MNMKVRYLLLRITLVIACIPVLVSCASAAPTQITPTQIAQDNGIQDIRVLMTEPVKATSRVEQFPLPNCGGTDNLTQSLGTYASASKSATVGGTATVKGGGEVEVVPEVAKLKLEIQVELAYQKTFESEKSRLDSIGMSAAAGTHVVYTIVWEEQIFDSIVQYSADGKVYEVPYTYRLSVPKTDKSYNVECPTRETLQGQPHEVATPVPPIQPTALEIDFSWVEREVKILNGFIVTWRECPGESPSSCVQWNAYEHSDSSFVPMEILRCKQDGTWLDESGKENTGLSIGIYNRVSGITIRNCP